MPVPRLRRRFRGLARSRIKLAKRVLTKLVSDSTPPGPHTLFQVGDIAAATIVLNALDAGLAATDPR